MKLSVPLLTIVIVAVPLWYLFRTATDEHISVFEWRELFMTREQILAKRTADKQKLKEDAEAARLQKETALAEALKAKKIAEAEAAKAELDVIVKKNEEAEQVARRQIEAAKHDRDAAIARIQAEGANARKQQAIRARLSSCTEATAAAESNLKALQAEQKTYRQFLDETATVPIKFDPSWRSSEFARAFKAFERSAYLALVDPDDIRISANTCVVAATGSPEDEPWTVEQAVNDIKRLSERYLKWTADMSESRKNIVGLIDYYTGKLGETVGAQVMKERIEAAIHGR